VEGREKEGQEERGERKGGEREGMLPPPLQSYFDHCFHTTVQDFCLHCTAAHQKCAVCLLTLRLILTFRVQRILKCCCCKPLGHLLMPKERLKAKFIYMHQKSRRDLGKTEVPLVGKT